MSNKPDGGPAFPLVAEAHEHVISVGMSMRDYFAAKVIQGLMVGGTKGDPLDVLADISYRMADEMVKRRES